MKFISKIINYLLMLMITILVFSLGVYADENGFSVNGNYYSTLEEAIDVVPDGGIIVFEKDYYDKGFIILNVQKKFSIDLNGHTYSSTNCYGNFYIYSGDVTFYDSVGGGKVVNTAFENANAKTFLVYKVYDDYVSNLTLNNISVIGNSYGVSVEKESVVILNNVIINAKYNFYLGNNYSLTINGGNYTASASTMYGLNVTNVDSISMNINSGKFISNNDNFMFSTVLKNKSIGFVNGGIFNKDVTDYISSTKKVIVSNNFYTVVDKDYKGNEESGVVNPIDNNDANDDIEVNSCKVYLDQISQKNSEIDNLKSQIEQLKAEMASKEAILNARENELNAKEEMLNNRENELNSKEEELYNKELDVINNKNFNDIQSAELLRREEELELKNDELFIKEQDLINKEVEILNKEESLEEEKIQMASKELLLTTKEQELNEKDVEILNLKLFNEGLSLILENKNKELELKEQELNDKMLQLNSKEEELNNLYNQYLKNSNDLSTGVVDNYNIDIDINPLDENINTDIPIVGIVNNDFNNALLVINSSLEDNVNIDRDLSIVFNYSLNNISNNVKDDILKNYGDKYYLNEVFDIGFNVLDKKDNSYVGNITKLNKKIRFTILLPDSLKNTLEDDIFIVKLHNGQYNLIKADISSDKSTLSFETSEFSVFGILSLNDNDINSLNVVSSIVKNDVDSINNKGLDTSSLSSKNIVNPRTSSSSIIKNIFINKNINNYHKSVYFIYCLLIGFICFVIGFISRRFYSKVYLKC